MKIAKEAKDYRFYAEQCRTFAGRTSDATHRDILLKMAETWEQLAQKAELGGTVVVSCTENDEPEPETRP